MEVVNIIGDNGVLSVLTMQRYTVFRDQDVENGNFDVIFQFGEKKLYAHSFILWSASEVFKAMLLGSMATKNPIPITRHTYDEFRAFLTFFYLGKCKTTVESVLAIVDLAESYKVQLLKDKCDTFIFEKLQQSKNYLEVYEKIYPYSLPKSEKLIADNLFIQDVIEKPIFWKLEKDFIIALLKKNHAPIKEKDILQKVYQWAEARFPEDDVIDVEGFMKSQLKDFLPLIDFTVMDYKFLHEFLLPRKFLLKSPAEFDRLLMNATSHGIYPYSNRNFNPKLSDHYRTKLQFTDRNGKKAFAWITEKSVIESIRSRLYYREHRKRSTPISWYECFWNIKVPSPKQKFDIYAKEISNFYVIRNSNGRLGLKDLLDNITENEAAECEVLAALELEDDTFDIHFGTCELKIIENV